MFVTTLGLEESDSSLVATIRTIVSLAAIHLTIWMSRRFLEFKLQLKLKYHKHRSLALDCTIYSLYWENVCEISKVSLLDEETWKIWTLHSPFMSIFIAGTQKALHGSYKKLKPFFKDFSWTKFIFQGPFVECHVTRLTHLNHSVRTKLATIYG